MKKTTYFYIVKEILPIFFIGLMILTVILLMDKILKLIELIVTRGVSLSQILMLLLFISPSFLIFTIPMAVLLGHSSPLEGYRATVKLPHLKPLG